MSQASVYRVTLDAVGNLTWVTVGTDRSRGASRGTSCKDIWSAIDLRANEANRYDLHQPVPPPVSAIVVRS